MRYELNPRLRTHSCGQDLTPSRLARAENGGKKRLKGSEKLLKSVFSGRSQGSDSVFGSRSLIDCRFQFLTVYISVYDSSASHVLEVRCKDLSEDVSSRRCYKFLAGQMLSSEMTSSLWFCVLLRLRVEQTIPLKLMENRSRGGRALRTLVYTRIIFHRPRDCLMSLARMYWYIHGCSAIIFNQLHPNCLYG